MLARNHCTYVPTMTFISSDDTTDEGVRNDNNEEEERNDATDEDE